jgi:hypothetical protein
MDSGGRLTDDFDAAYQILAYLHNNPEAQDTLEGIVEWWLLHQRIKHQTEKVKQAVAELIGRGFISAHEGTDSRVHYRIDRDRLEEIELLLRNWPRP